LELALGGGERSSGPVEPLPLFVQLLDRAEIHVQPSSPELAFVGLNGRERTNSPDQVLLSSSHVRPPGKGASLLLSLAVPQYRKEGNSWVEVEEEAGALGLDDVEFALTL
jgi:serine/arginine repetitive matrix protein 2